MSACLEETELIRLLNGELDRQETLNRLDHLKACAACAERYQALKATWSVLGRWEVEPGRFDLTERVLAAAQARPAQRNWLPLAACIAMAAGLGLTAGLLGPERATPRNTPAVSSEQIVRTLGIDTLGEDSIALGDVLTPRDEAGEDEELHS